jgi:hypothetical protein
MVEPAPPPGFVARSADYQAAAAVPRLLVLDARKLPPDRAGAPAP